MTRAQELELLTCSASGHTAGHTAGRTGGGTQTWRVSGSAGSLPAGPNPGPTGKAVRFCRTPKPWVGRLHVHIPCHCLRPLNVWKESHGRVTREGLEGACQKAHRSVGCAEYLGYLEVICNYVRLTHAPFFYLEFIF